MISLVQDISQSVWVHDLGLKEFSAERFGGSGVVKLKQMVLSMSGVHDLRECEW